MRSLVDGVPARSVPVTDSAVLRGDGCFEAIRCYQGVPFALEEHLERLARSAAMLRIPPPPPDDLARWCRDAAAGGGDGMLRVVVTRGDDLPGAAGGSRCIVVHHPLPARRDVLRLAPLPAPWHPAGRPWELAGAKTLSYAPNLAASRRAEEEGWDDALLVSDGGIVLEGPTFSVAWTVGGVVETPSLELSILDSITRRHVLDAAREMGMEVREGSFPLDWLNRADEVVAMSTSREVLPVVAVGDLERPAGPVAEKLLTGFRERVVQEIRSQGRAPR